MRRYISMNIASVDGFQHPNVHLTENHENLNDRIPCWLMMSDHLNQNLVNIVRCDEQRWNNFPLVQIPKRFNGFRTYVQWGQLNVLGRNISTSIAGVKSCVACGSISLPPVHVGQLFISAHAIHSFINLWVRRGIKHRSMQARCTWTW